jgi:hypothetical protein
MKLKFCTGCQKDRAEDGGSYKTTRTMRRWMCKTCTDKHLQSRRTLKEKQDGPAQYRNDR